MSHLGSLISALADGQLSPEETERALAHVAACSPCASELAAARAARTALASAGDLRPDPDLTARLLALGAVPPVAPKPRPALGSTSLPMPGSGPRLPLVMPGELPARRRLRLPVVAGVLAGALLVVMFALGDEPEVTLSGRPVEALATLHDAALAVDASDAVASGDVQHELSAWLAQHAWAVPVVVPDGYRVAAVRGAAEELEVDLVGPDGLAVLTQTRGRLTAAGRAVEVGGRRVTLLDDGPWSFAWQSGDAVVSVVAEGPPWAAAPVVAAYPDLAYDGGAQARVNRGWQILVTAWSGS